LNIINKRIKVWDNFGIKWKSYIGDRTICNMMDFYHFPGVYFYNSFEELIEILNNYKKTWDTNKKLMREHFESQKKLVVDLWAKEFDKMFHDLPEDGRITNPNFEVNNKRTMKDYKKYYSDVDGGEIMQNQIFVIDSMK
jgi:hypothetical protein